MNSAVALSDKYELDTGRVLISGPQAITRILLSQARRDRADGLNTGGFVSGYRGSPLGGVDSALWRAKRELDREGVVFQAGVNEELAATAVWGSQQLAQFGPAKHEGVFGAWYGKGPGVDRAGDALKHGNLAGAAAHGGVLVFAGDDHPGKSSTTAHQSEQALVASAIPVLYPASVEELLQFGQFGYAFSRFTGLWAGIKCVNDTADATMNALLPPERSWVRPAVDLPEGGLNILIGEPQLSQERRTIEFRLPAAQAFARANGFDRLVINPRAARLCIVSAGKAFLDVREALYLLGVDDARAAALGIRLLKLGMTWPLDPEAVVQAARGCREVMIVEEKRAFIEPQVKDALYHLPQAERPEVSGKSQAGGGSLLSSVGELSPAIVAQAIATRLIALNLADAAFRAAQAACGRTIGDVANAALTDRSRAPYFCSGCPHNSSTAVPAGSVALAGIGCHVLSIFMPHRPHARPVQMGGEGANWIGAAPFSDTKHVFQNLGDGTYFHSGLLAIRAAIAAKINITYKLLFNDAVAMTGGQPVEGALTPPQIARELIAEGVTRLVIVADDPSRYDPVKSEIVGVSLYPREDLDMVQRELRDLGGVTVIIYDQVCAAEKRRRRKRGTFAEPTKRLFINELVCEGCGDCSVKSNCVSVQPKETEFGRKRVIDQSSCNKDYSCGNGFCPSFVTVEGGKIRSRASGGGKAINVPELPEPPIAACANPVSIFVTGIGGTGVITVGAVLAMAAHLEGKGASVVDMTGVSQKNGAVYSHVKIAARPDDLRAAKIATGQADLLIACDLVAASSQEALSFISASRTRAVVNHDVVATAEFTFTPDLDLQGARTAARLLGHLIPTDSFMVDAGRLATALLGDTITINMFMVGAALQRGVLPVSRGALEQAITLNGIDVERNILALTLGRWSAVDLPAVEALSGPGGAKIDKLRNPDSLDDIVAVRSAFLINYQGKAYADRYKRFVSLVRQHDATFGEGFSLTHAVARYLFKLMAYKDEYEVARLSTSADFMASLSAQFEGKPKLRFNLAPPLLARRDPVTGVPRKMSFGAWIIPMFKVLAAMRGLRGTAFDPFGYTSERKLERALISDYLNQMESLVADLTEENYSVAVEIASLPENIRGYGHVKSMHLAKVRARGAELQDRFRASGRGVPKAKLRDITLVA